MSRGSVPTHITVGVNRCTDCVRGVTPVPGDIHKALQVNNPRCEYAHAAPLKGGG